MAARRRYVSAGLPVRKSLDRHRRGTPAGRCHSTLQRWGAWRVQILFQPAERLPIRLKRASSRGNAQSRDVVQLLHAAQRTSIPPARGTRHGIGAGIPVYVRPVEGDLAIPGIARSERALLLAGGLTGVIIATSGCSSSTGEPLDVGPGGTFVSIARPVGTQVVFGVTIIKNNSADPIRITEVSFVSDQKHSGATVVESWVWNLTGVSTAVGIGEAPFPPPQTSRDAYQLAKGATIEPFEPYQLVVVVRIDKDGAWHWPRYEVRYEAGSRKLESEGTNALMVCAPLNSECDPSRVGSS